MANDNKKRYVDPNPYAGYGPAMAQKAGDPMAVEWQNANDAAVAAATTPKALASHLWDAKDAEALLARVKGAYESDPLDLTVIGAVSQYVMEAVIGRADGCQKCCSTPGAAPCQRKIRNMALINAIKKSKDEYVQTFMLDQLRWCGCKCRKGDVSKLKAFAVSENVKAYIDWVVADMV